MKIKKKEFFYRAELWFLFLFLIFFLSFFSVFQKLFIRWHSGDNNYCYLVLPVFLYLCWERRKDFDFSQISNHPIGIFLFVISLGFIYLGELSSLETLLYLGIWLGVVSIALFLYGFRLKNLLFPFFILVFIVPLPPFINRILTFRLQMLTSSLAVYFMRFLGFPVYQEGNIIDLGVAQLQVVEACSGLRYFMSFIFMALLISYYFLKRWWGKLLLLMCVLPVSILANAFRISFMGWLYSHNLEKWTEGFYHYFSGWLVFIIAAFFLLFLAYLIRFLEKKSVFQKKDKKPLKRNLTFSPFSFGSQILLLSLIILLGGIGYKGLPAHFPHIHTNFSAFPMEIEGWYGERFSLSPQILHSLWADEYISAVYFKKGFSGRIYLLIPYYSYQTTRHTAHAPQSCLLGSGWSILKSGEWKLKINSQKFLPVRYMYLERNPSRMLATYFFLQRGRIITSPWWNKFYLLRDSIFMHKTNGALVRVEMLLGPEQTFDEAEKELKKFLLALWPILNQFIPK